MKKIAGYITLILSSLMILLGISVVSYTAIMQISGLAVAQSPTRWNNVIDAAVGDSQTRGILGTSLYLYNGTNFDRARGDTTYGLDVDVTRVSGSVTVTGDKTPSDAYANPTDAINSYSLLGVFNGTTWDRARGDITNGLDVDVTRVQGVVATSSEKSGNSFYAIKTTVQATQVTGEVIGTGDGTTTSFSGTLAHFPVVRNTLSVSYTIGGTTYYGSDDGNGNITGTNISSGTINYSTGAWSITFTAAPDSGTDISADYRYSTSVNIPFGFTSKKVAIQADAGNSAEICIDWTGGPAECPGVGNAGDDYMPPGVGVVLDDYAVSSISITTESTSAQTVYVRAWN